MADNIIDNKISVYCPICQSYGYKKIIGKVHKNAKGTIYLYCKGFATHGNQRVHKAQEIEIELGQGAASK